MSGEEDEGGLLRTVTEPYRSRTDEEMNLIGLLYGAGLVLVLIPLAPFLLLLWALSRLTEPAREVEVNQ